MPSIANLAVKLSLESAAFVRGTQVSQRQIDRLTRKVQKSARQFAKWGAVVSGVAAGATVLLVKNSLKYVDALAKTSDKLGVTTEGLAALQFQAKLAGVETNVLEKALQNMTRGIAEAAVGTGEAKDALKELGLNAAELQFIGPERALAKVADRLQEVDNATRKVGLAYDLFGGRGTALINVLAGGSAEINRSRKEAESLGLTVDRLGAAQVENANDAITRFGFAVRGAGVALAVRLAPFIKATADQMTDWAMKSNADGGFLVNVFEGIVSAVAKVGDAIIDTDLAFKKFSLGLQRQNVGIASLFFGEDVILEMAQDTSNLADEIAKLEASAKPSSKVSQFFQNIRDRAKEAAEEALKLKGITPGLNDNIDATNFALDDTEDRLKRQKRLADGVGSAFGSAFATASQGASKFGDALKGLAADIQRVLVNRLIAEPIAAGVSGFFNSTAAVKAPNSPAAGGGIGLPSLPTGGVGPAQPTMFARGGIIDSPVRFPMRRGMGMAGESGAEGIFPLKRMPDGDLGVRAVGGGGGGMVVNVKIINNSGERVSTRQQSSPDGGRELLVQIGEHVAADVNTGGPVAQAIQRSFGVKRSGVRT